MDKAKLREYLQIDTKRLYCVLDGASVPDLPKRLFDMKPPHFCLFSGELPADMLHVAPYVIYLPRSFHFTDWILDNGFGQHWGIFAHSRHSMKEMRRHFRGLVNVYDESAASLIFRFYDPRVLRRFLPTCNAGELKSFFGKIDTFFGEDEESKKLLRFQIEDNKLKRSELE